MLQLDKAPSEAAAGLWIEAAARIGARLVTTARWTDERCTWEVRVPVREPGVRRSRTELAGGTLYQGTAGIAVFLGELYRHTQERRVLAAAEGAIRHALASLPASANANFGFHGGRVGIAYSCYRLGIITDRDDLLKSAEQCLLPLVGNEDRDGALDVIGGAAGAIPILLVMANRLSSAVTREPSVALGEHLIRSARRGLVGWSWPGMTSASRDLTGYAHGTAGFAHALLELFAATGDERFRYGAAQAFAYEQHFFNPEEHNWPDFRHMDLSEYLSYGRTEALRARLRTGGPFPPYRKRFMSAWCHGAPGIGLARLRAYELLEDETYLDQARAAIENTVREPHEGFGNYSLCHGRLGNCETLLMADRLLHWPAVRAVAEQRALEGYRQFEEAGRAWPCGTMGGESDASLLIGEAGIGYFFLRLHDAQTPSVLCPVPSIPATPVASNGQSADLLRRAHIGQHFGSAVTAVERLQANRPSVLEDAAKLAGDSDILRVHAALEARIEAESMLERRALLADAFAVERARFVLDLQIDDFTTELLDTIARPDVAELQWDSVHVWLADHVQLVHTSHDWQGWHGENGRASAEPAYAPAVTLVYRRANEARASTLGPFTAVVLESASQPGTWADITDRVTARLENATVQQLAGPVLEQIKTAYASGILTVVTSPVAR